MAISTASLTRTQRPRRIDTAVAALRTLLRAKQVQELNVSVVLGRNCDGVPLMLGPRGLGLKPYFAPYGFSPDESGLKPDLSKPKFRLIERYWGRHPSTKTLTLLVRRYHLSARKLAALLERLQAK